MKEVYTSVGVSRAHTFDKLFEVAVRAVHQEPSLEQATAFVLFSRLFPHEAAKDVGTGAASSTVTLYRSLRRRVCAGSVCFLV